LPQWQQHQHVPIPQEQKRAKLQLRVAQLQHQQWRMTVLRPLLLLMQSLLMVMRLQLVLNP
jgi:hypothetical protein